MNDTTEQAVVETPAPDASATEVAKPESSTGAVETGESSERKDPLQKRFDKLTWQLRQAERERDYERELRLTALQSREQPKPAADSKPALKKLADFDFDEERYAEYVADVAAERAARKLEETRAAKDTERTRKERLVKFKELETKFKTEIDDYEDVAHYARIDDHVVEAVIAMDEGPRIAYYLGKNPDVAARLNSLTDGNLVAMELGRIDARLSFEREAKAKSPPVSKAPPPPPKIEASEGATRVSTTDPESDKTMTDDEWVKAERARLERKKKRAAT